MRAVSAVFYTVYTAGEPLQYLARGVAADRGLDLDRVTRSDARIFLARHGGLRSRAFNRPMASSGVAASDEYFSGRCQWPSRWA